MAKKLSKQRGGLTGEPREILELVGKDIREEGYVEVTLQYPRTSSFTNMVSTKQKQIYRRSFNHIKDSIPMNLVEDYGHVYEYCENGHVHLHGYIQIKGTHCPIGVVSDVVKTYLNVLPKKYGRYKEGCISYEYLRYRDRPICCQYRNLLEKSKWVDGYMQKHQEKKIDFNASIFDE